MSNETIKILVSELSNEYIQFSGGNWCNIGDNNTITIALSDAAGNLKKALYELEEAQTRVDSLKYALKRILLKEEAVNLDPKAGPKIKDQEDKK